MVITDPKGLRTGEGNTSTSPSLFDPYTLRGITFRNRIMVSPMCQYSSEDGFAHDWHLVHLGSRAVGGAGLVMTEATAVTAEGRISPQDLGLWKDEQIEFLTRITGFLRENGAVPAMQLSHAGRKSSSLRPWEGGGPLPSGEGDWRASAPSPVPFRPDYPIPHELTRDEIAGLVAAFRRSTERALRAGFEVIELHAAHGYLIDEFLSPLANLRTDEYGGTFENRIRFLLEVIQSVRSVWPERYPLFVRFSCTDWVEGGWTEDDSVVLARIVGLEGVDLIDCSTGGVVPDARVPVGPNYQVPFAARIRRETGVPTAAVGLITDADQADSIIRQGEADLVALARADLRDPYWPLHAAKELGREIVWPPQYERAKA